MRPVWNKSLENRIGQTDTFRMGRADRRVRLRETPTPRAVNGWAAGHDAYTATMILALAARHRAERPAMGMEGGLITYGAA